MASRILSKRLLTASLRSNVGLTSKTSMSSSSSTPSTTKKQSSVKSQDHVPTKESPFIRYWPFQKNYLPANANDGPISEKDMMMPEVVEASTGEEKLVLLAFENGFIDPYCTLPTSREGKGTKDNPVIIESFFPERMIACVCEPEQTFHNFTHINYGEKKRCQCGYWMEMREAPRFWEKIPKEELLDITFFRDLEEDGLLDDYLNGKYEEVIHKLEAQADAQQISHH